jgi:hypothetical protein
MCYPIGMSNGRETELLTVQELSVESGLAETTIRDAINTGRLPYIIKYGRKLVERAAWETYRKTARRGRPHKQKGDTEV